MDIAEWLESLGLGEYAPAFAENRIGADLLPELTDQDLRDLGITALGDRKRLLAAIASLERNDGATSQPAAAPSPEGERRQVTVLFSDIAGFTSLSERIGAEATHEILNRYFEAADRIIEDFGGSVDKHIGDNVMGVFGAPVAHDNDPERAVRAALAIQEAVRVIEVPGESALRLHIGIAAGQVVASGTGSASHLQYTVTGDSVNLAARLQGLAGPDETLISEAVQRQTAGRFKVVGLGPQEIKGIERPVEVWRVEGVAAEAADAGGALFVGRRAELRQCQAILDEVAAAGEGQVILLRGAAGIGKTRLASEVVRRAHAAGFAVQRCLVLDFGSLSGQSGVPALVAGLLGIGPSSDTTARAAAADGAEAQGAFAAAERVFLNDLLDLPQPAELSRAYDAMDEATRREGRRRLVVGLVEWASRAAPQLILVEDLHWADGQTLDMLAAVLGATRELPVLFVGTTRPEGDPLDGPWRSLGLEHPVSVVNLGPLRPDEARALAAGLAQTNQSRLSECLERAGGNPLFLEQLLQSMAESAEALLPGSIQSLVLARMDRLDAPDKRAAQAASVLGQRFGMAALQHLIGDATYDCAGLLRHQLVRPEGDDFLFTHALIREGVYESILTPARKRLHLKAAAWFADRDAVLRAEHLGMADDPGAATAYLEAAQAQLRRYRYEQAVALLEKGKALAREPAERVALALALGEAQHDLGALGEARAAFEEALDVAADDVGRCCARLGLAAVKRITEELDGALADLDAAQAEARRLGLEAEQARAHYLRGNILFPRGDIEGCLREHETALALARSAGSAELEAAALGGLGDADYMLGRLKSAHARFSACVEVSREHGLGRIEVANLPMAAIAATWCGDTERAHAMALEAVETARQVGHARAEMIAHHAAFLCERASPETPSIRDHVKSALELARRLSARRFEAEALLFGAELDFRAGDREKALATVRDAVSMIREVGMAFLGPAILGGLALVTDDPTERRAASAEAETLLEAGSISHNHILFRTYAIEACLRAGEYDDAERHADALVDYCPEEGLEYVLFQAECGRALARAGRGEQSEGLACALDRLISAGERMQQMIAVADLSRARGALKRVRPNKNGAGV